MTWEIGNAFLDDSLGTREVFMGWKGGGSIVSSSLMCCLLAKLIIATPPFSMPVFILDKILRILFFYSGSGFNAFCIVMFDLFHFGDQISHVKQFLWGVAAGYNYLDMVGAADQYSL